MSSNEYLVTWAIDIHAESPLSAVEAAWELMRGDYSTANVFSVTNKVTKNKITLDTEGNIYPNED